MTELVDYNDLFAKPKEERTLKDRTKFKKNLKYILVFVAILSFPYLIFDHLYFFGIYTGESMDFQENQILFCRKASFESIQVNDIVAYEGLTGNVIHRVIYRFENELVTKGDNNEFADRQSVTKDNFIGKC